MSKVIMSDALIDEVKFIDEYITKKGTIKEHISGNRLIWARKETKENINVLKLSAIIDDYIEVYIEYTENEIIKFEDINLTMSSKELYIIFRCVYDFVKEKRDRIIQDYKDGTVKLLNDYIERVMKPIGSKYKKSDIERWVKFRDLVVKGYKEMNIESRDIDKLLKRIDCKIDYAEKLIEKQINVEVRHTPVIQSTESEMFADEELMFEGYCKELEYINSRPRLFDKLYRKYRKKDIIEKVTNLRDSLINIYMTLDTKTSLNDLAKYNTLLKRINKIIEENK